jgi:hypothetical protein
MSTLRPSRRDDLEKLYLAKIAEALDIQRQLDGVEAPRMPVKGDGEAKDGLDSISPTRLATLPESPDDGDLVEVDGIADDQDGQGEADWQARSARILALCTGILRQIKAPEEKTPKLIAHVALLALGADCESMRQVSKAYGISVERVRQRAEKMRVTFNLHKNQHNKSERAVESYKRTARLFNTRQS